MTEIYIYTFASVFIVSLISLIGAIAISMSKRFLGLIVPVLVSLAAGALLGDAFIHLIPEAFEESESSLVISLLIILGILVFFVFEKFLHWHHSHGESDIDEYCDCDHVDEEGRVRPVGRMVLVSDAFHNFIDGLIIAASFLVSVPVGIATTIAILFHEIPQELGDFGVLLHAGYSKKKALFMNFLSAVTAFLGAATVLFFGSVVEGAIIWLIPIAAGGFIYIAAVDLIPELHKTTEVKRSLLQFFAFLIGIIAMMALMLLE
ncbi:ZIP family metal transporter [Patescibacteria group bacterium]